MRTIVIAMLVLAFASSLLAADRATMPENPNAYVQPEGWSDGLMGEAPVIMVERSTTVYTNLADFLAILNPGYYFDDFAWVDWGDPYAPSYDFGPVNGYSYTVSSAGEIFGIPGAISTNTPNEPMIIVFTGLPVTAVGGDFFCTDFDGAPESVSTIVALADGTTVTLDWPTVFVGFSSTVPITSLVIDTDATAAVWVTLDNFYVGETGVIATESLTLSHIKTLFQ
jgi:hypothetical protein